MSALCLRVSVVDDEVTNGTAVADFGRKTRSVAAGMTAEDYDGQGDLCHIIPGMLEVCDRNLLPVVLAPLPMLAGHGRRDTGSHREHAAEFRTICEAQYAALDASANYSYLIHEGGDEMPSREVVDWFARQFHVQ